VSAATLINCFEVPNDREEEFLALWHEADALLRDRGGYATTRLHKAVGPDSRYRYINIAELDSVETWRDVITSPAFTAIAARMADFQSTPGLYTVAVTNTSHRQPTPS
jgi:antibiotic biosynthesis monooxygenase (ABM) superfamily enzyme